MKDEKTTKTIDTQQDEPDKAQEPWYLVRCRDAGVFFGRIESRDGSEVTMTDARRLWQWYGATECCQLAAEGVAKPKECKFTLWVKQVVLLDAIEIHTCTDAAAKSIEGVSVWKA